MSPTSQGDTLLYSQSCKSVFKLTMAMAMAGAGAVEILSTAPKINRVLLV